MASGRAWRRPGLARPGGPLHVTRARTNPLVHAFVEAGRQAGYPLTDDYNGARQEGFGPFDMTVWQGERWSAAQAYLRPALKRPNCDLIRAEARRVVIEGGRATGVEIARGGRVETVRRAGRGDRRGLGDQFAKAADAVGDRPGRIWPTTGSP